MHCALQINEHRFTGCNIPVKPVTGAIQRHRFAGYHDCGKAIFNWLQALAHAQGANAERVSKRQQPMPGNQRYHRIRAANALVYAAHCGKNIAGLEWQATRGFLQFMRQHIEQHFRVAVGVDVPVVGGEQLGFERRSIGQIAVV